MDELLAYLMTLWVAANERNLEELTQLWNRADENGDGFLSYGEFATLIKEQKQGVGERQIKAMFREAVQASGTGENKIMPGNFVAVARRYGLGSLRTTFPLAPLKTGLSYNDVRPRALAPSTPLCPPSLLLMAPFPLEMCFICRRLFGLPTPHPSQLIAAHDAARIVDGGEAVCHQNHARHVGRPFAAGGGALAAFASLLRFRIPQHVTRTHCPLSSNPNRTPQLLDLTTQTESLDNLVSDESKTDAESSWKLYRRIVLGFTMESQRREVVKREQDKLTLGAAAYSTEFDLGGGGRGERGGGKVEFL